MIQKNNRLIKVLIDLDIIIASVAMVILTILAFVGVVARYVFGAPIPWQQEIQILCYIWLAYFGVCACVRRGGHIAIDIVVDMLPKKVARVIEACDFLILLAVLLFSAWVGTQLVMQLYTMNRISGVLNIPYWIFYFPMPVGMVLTAVNYIGMKIYERKRPANGSENIEQEGDKT